MYNLYGVRGLRIVSIELAEKNSESCCILIFVLVLAVVPNHLTWKYGVFWNGWWAQQHRYQGTFLEMDRT